MLRARKKLEFKLVLWAISSHNLLACGNLLLVLVYDFIIINNNNNNNNNNNMFKQDDHFSYKNCYQYGSCIRG